MKTRKTGCRRWLFLIVGLVITVMLWDTLVPSSAVRALPDEATQIREHYDGGRLVGDFTRLVKARIPEEKVAEYAQRVGATMQEQGGAGTIYLSWAHGPDWWRPTDPPRYFHYSTDYRILVGWEKGYVYFDAVAW